MLGVYAYPPLGVSHPLSQIPPPRGRNVPRGLLKFDFAMSQRQRPAGPLLESIWEIGKHHVLGLLVTVFSEGTPSLRLFRKGQDGGWDLTIVERRKDIIKVDLRPFQSTYPDGLGHQGNSKSRDHGIWIQTNSKAATFLHVTVPLEVVRPQTL